jgi:peptidoglycan/xylan/chitin deacetylase (PgdA/CDA1 family)
MQSFSYPFGDLSPQSKHAFASKSAAGPLAGFKVLRALHHGLIQTGTDLNQAPSVGVETDYGEANAMKWIERAAARNAWLILYTHDVIEAPSRFGCSPATLERLLQAALSRGFDIVTVAQAAQRIGL